MKISNTFSINGWTGFAVLAIFSIAAVQAQENRNSASTFNPDRVPLQLKSVVLALGSRVQTPGSERITMEGTFAESKGNSTATILLELPNKARITLTGPTSKSIGFDGQKGSASGASLTEQDEDLLETFVEDSAEGMLNAVRSTASLRVLATYSRMDDGTRTGRNVDVFQLAGPAQSRSSKSVRHKTYFVDSLTHQLVEVAYRAPRGDGSTSAVRVQYSNWTKIAGQSVPGTIKRVENGQAKFTLNISAASFSAKDQSNPFAAQ